jgi:hypothetical protein
MIKNAHRGTPHLPPLRASTADQNPTRTSWSYAITDAQPEKDSVAREMKICPKYFTDDQTKQSSNSDGKTYKPNPKRTDKSWCIKAPFKLKNFMVGGETLLHELTHFDSVGVEAGYPEFTYVD